jgi:hypothetical protein
MSLLLAPTEAQIEAQIDTLLDRRPDARILGIRSPMRRSWPELLERRGRRFRVSWCDSELEIREQLDAIEEGKGMASWCSRRSMRRALPAMS